MSYAQSGTDLAINRLFPYDYKGIYVDVGCSFPIIGSNTFLFYEKGWRGICIDPVKSCIQAHKLIRPEDTQIQCCVGNVDGSVVFYECEDTTLSTFIIQEIEKRKLSGKKIGPSYEIKMFKLDTILKDIDHKSIDLISIDVEGAELDVLLGYSNLAAKVLVIEACEPCTENSSYHEWEYLLIDNNYRYFQTCGVNRIYRKEKS